MAKTNHKNEQDTPQSLSATDPEELDILEEEFVEADVPSDEFDLGVIEPPAEPEPGKASKKSSGGAHAKGAQSAYIQKSTRMRTILIVVLILLVILLIAIGVMGFRMFNIARDTAVQQTLTTDIDDATSTDDAASDATPTVTKKTTVPDLTVLFGKTEQEAVDMLKHGAEVTRSLEVNEEGNPIKWDVQIALTDEPSDSRSGTPTVYLGINDQLQIIRAGYSVATSSLGYGSLSFADAVTNEHIVEKTLTEAGLTVGFGDAVLPPDKMDYSTYATDGTTMIKEYYDFKGVGNASGVERNWEAILSYDYTMANATGNLNDTIRTIYIYIS